MAMHALTREQLVAEATRFDAAVLATPGIDHFCSSTDWILPADTALMPEREPWLFRSDDGGGYVALSRGKHAGGWSYLQPLEAAWGLASPVVAADSGRLVAELVELLGARQQEWDLLFLSGLPQGKPVFSALVEQLSRRYALRLGTPTRRHRASLLGGVDGFLSRRTRNLRRTLRRAGRRAERDGITIEANHTTDLTAADAAYGRILEVESRSWKGHEGVGIDRGSMCDFYRAMNRRLVARGAQRLFFARHQGRDVGYILGGVLGDTYRGLQFSFDDDYRAHSLGALMQLRQIEELCAAGYATYDLGTDIAYKERWADQTLDTALLIVARR